MTRLAATLLVVVACGGSGSDIADSEASVSETDADLTPVATSDAWAQGTWPAACHAQACAASEWCVLPGATCDYRACATGGAAEWRNAPPRCVPAPTHCLRDGAFDPVCLNGAFCGPSASEPGYVSDDGVYVCYPEAIDCFC